MAWETSLLGGVRLWSASVTSLPSSPEGICTIRPMSLPDSAIRNATRVVSSKRFMRHPYSARPDDRSKCVGCHPQLL